MSYGKVLKYKNENNVEESIFLKPVSPMKFKEMFRLARKLSGKEDMLQEMDDETVQDLVTLCIETMDRSKPDWSKDMKEEFITMHFNDLVSAIFELNSPKQ